MVRLLPLIAAVALLALFSSVGSAKAPLPARTVPCDEIIDATAFPYLGGSERANRYRLVLGVVSAPPAYMPQTVPTNATPWTYWRKAGLVVRDGAGPVTITVPRAWRTRAAIQWGNGTRRPVQLASNRPLRFRRELRERLRGRLPALVTLGVRPARRSRRRSHGDRPLRRRPPLHRLVARRLA